MQLDKTRIAIRERQYVDILDLAVRVCRVHAWPLLLAFSAGVVPMMLLNKWLLSGYDDLAFELGLGPQYMFFAVLLVVVEAPLATAPATLYLGKAMFSDRPNVREIVRELWESLPQLLVYQVLFRLWYFRWTYLNEVILLDRNPMRRKTPGGKTPGGKTPGGETTASRGRILHRGEGGDLVGRGVSVAAVGGLLAASIWLSIYLLRIVLTGQWAWELPSAMYTFYFPLTLWIVAGYLTVVRFLCYLDLRIRREGWEVELTMRAERARLTRRWQ